MPPPTPPETCRTNRPVAAAHGVVGGAAAVATPGSRIPHPLRRSQDGVAVAVGGRVAVAAAVGKAAPSLAAAALAGQAPAAAAVGGSAVTAGSRCTVFVGRTRKGGSGRGGGGGVGGEGVHS